MRPCLRPAVRSKHGDLNFADSTVILHSKTPVVANSPDILAAGPAYVAEIPGQIPELSAAVNELAAAQSSLAKSPVDRATAVTRINQAVALFAEALATLENTRAKSASDYATSIENLRNYYTLLVTAAGNEATQTIEEAKAAGGNAALLTEAESHRQAGAKAFAARRDTTAAAEYMNAVVSAANSLKSR